MGPVARVRGKPIGELLLLPVAEAAVQAQDPGGGLVLDPLQLGNFFERFLHD